MSARTAIPRRVFPERNGSEAPPPVETCVILPAIPSCVTASAVNPPPVTVVALRSASAVAMVVIPLENCGISNTPTGPFHTTVRHFLSSCVNADMVGVRYLQSCNPAGSGEHSPPGQLERLLVFRQQPLTHSIARLWDFTWLTVPDRDGLVTDAILRCSFC